MKIPTLKFKPFSLKQLKIMTWWCVTSPVKDKNGIIADGAIRAGKTVPMALSFVLWSITAFNGQNFGLCGKTVGSFKRNVWVWLKPVLIFRGFKVKKATEIGENVFYITYHGHSNYYYIFGGKDEGSQDLIQGITLAGVLFDEVALMPESFVNQATGRCSVEGSKWWFNCNPESPMHWFKVNWVDKAREKGLLHLHFMMDDNPSLSEEMKARYRASYFGVFFKRFILGLWVMADGAIYDMWTDDLLFDDDDLPHGIAHGYQGRRYIGVDYGTTNPMVFLDVRDDDKNLWLVNEYYWSSKDKGRQKTDSEYADDLIKFIGDEPYECIILDPSAASFKVECRRRGLRVRDADNEVLDGIRMTASMMGLKMLRVHRTKCQNFQKEVGAYIWDEKAAERGEEKPLKQADHVMDAARYIVKTMVRPRRLVA
jgi:PBSX family phage terminase large subunit